MRAFGSWLTQTWTPGCCNTDFTGSTRARFARSRTALAGNRATEGQRFLISSATDEARSVPVTIVPRQRVLSGQVQSEAAAGRSRRRYDSDRGCRDEHLLRIVGARRSGTRLQGHHDLGRVVRPGARTARGDARDFLQDFRRRPAEQGRHAAAALIRGGPVDGGVHNSTKCISRA